MRKKRTERVPRTEREFDKSQGTTKGERERWMKGLGHKGGEGKSKKSRECARKQELANTDFALLFLNQVSLSSSVTGHLSPVFTLDISALLDFSLFLKQTCFPSPVVCYGQRESNNSAPPPALTSQLFHLQPQWYSHKNETNEMCFCFSSQSFATPLPLPSPPPPKLTLQTQEAGRRRERRSEGRR